MLIESVIRLKNRLKSEILDHKDDEDGNSSKSSKDKYKYSLFNYSNTGEIPKESGLLIEELHQKLHKQDTELLKVKAESEALESFMLLLKDSDREAFFSDFLNSITKYVKAQQSILFLERDNGLYPVSAYACIFDETPIEESEGLVGQCFKQKRTIHIKNQSPEYFGIESGLGNATNAQILLVPMLYNGECLGVMEFATCYTFTEIQIQLTEKVAGHLASVCYNQRNLRKMQELMQTLNEQNQVMLEKEEMLRQNIEELYSSQEAMKEKQIIIDQQSVLMKMIVDYIPFPVFVKDEEGRYTLINRAEAELLNCPEDDIIGSSDQKFVQHESEWEVIQTSDRKVLDSEHPVELDEQAFTTPDGKHYLFKTTKVPFVNNITGKKNILGVSIDLNAFRKKE